MNKITKCRNCGKYQIKYKSTKHKKKQLNLFPELDDELQRVSEWKWCTLKNNWCRYVATHCDYIPINKQQPKKENKLLQEIEEMNSKKSNGQYFTTTNPFTEKTFLDWFNSIPISKRNVLLEPFAGSNNIVKMINDNLDYEPKWYCYDIEPPAEKLNAVPQLKVIKRDTIEKFPTDINARVAITNPPYLAKNSATRNGLPYKYPEYDDLYKKCLEVMLSNCEYVAAIIPESFITANLFHNRLKTVISLTCKMFEDTECPVCLALFSPEETEDFDIYRKGNIKIGTFKSLSSHIVNCNYGKWKFNDKTGSIGIECCDDTKTESIRFIEGSKIDPNSIKVSSRSNTRISGLPEGIDLNKFLAKCNSILSDYRKETQDVFLTSFMGLRADGKYRRRLDFDTAKNIMSKALKDFTEV